MPREKQKRGRRADAKKRDDSKRHRQDLESGVDAHSERPMSENSKKRQKLNHPNSTTLENNFDFIPLESPNDNDNECHRGDGGDGDYTSDVPFYGLLDSEEQEYFSRMGQILDANAFEGGEEDRAAFVERIFEMADGKELKIACSQSCSRLMERMIMLATPVQLKKLFEKFTGQFLNLAQHRFASHCCETLFIQSVTVLDDEMSRARKSGKGDKGKHVEQSQEAAKDKEIKKVEDLIVGVVTELSGSWGYLFTERFASHTIRVLLLILAGEPLDQPKTVVASRKKEVIEVSDPRNSSQAQTPSCISMKRPIPASFKTILDLMMKEFVASLDDTYMRALATHPLGNPVLQVLVQLELTHLGKKRINDPESLIRKILPDETMEEDTATATFLRGLMYDAVGSRLVETIVKYVPGKTFKTMFKQIFKERIGSFARNEIAAYVVVRVLERLSKENLEACAMAILPEVPSLMDRGRLIVIRTLFERAAVRRTPLNPLVKAVEGYWTAHANGSTPSEAGEFLSSLFRSELPLHEPSSSEKPGVGVSSAEDHQQKLQKSLLAQAMLKVHGAPSDCIQSSLLIIPVTTLIQLCKNPVASHLVQQALLLPTATPAFRRQLSSRLISHYEELALDRSGSHVADCLWKATADIMHIKELAAQKMVDNEAEIRASLYGKAVWRNWHMDLFKRRRREWKGLAKFSFLEAIGSGAVNNASTSASASGIGIGIEHKNMQSKPDSKI